MSRGFDRKEYWEKKILPWESSRYSGNAWLRPNSWTLRHRMNRAAALAQKVLPAGGSLLELGCGSGLFAHRLKHVYGSYTGIDLAETAIAEARARKLPAAQFLQADVLAASPAKADVAVALGLLDWLSPEEAARLLPSVPARFLILSYTQESLSPYGLYRAWYDSRFGGGVYRARSYSFEQIQGWLPGRRLELQPAACLDPGRLVLVERAKDA